MKLKHGLHLAYCTNIHRGEDWAETFRALDQHTLQVRRRVADGALYAIGLRLSARAARELSEPGTLRAFQQWLDRHHCYIFTINGFPYGQFHGGRVKEQVYSPDWTSPDRLEYTKLLFDLLAQLVPEGVEGSVSTVPCSFKSFITQPGQVQLMRRNLWLCIEHIAGLSERSGRQLHLGLEPEPLCYLETSAETVLWFEQMRSDRGFDPRLTRHLGVNYDACHLAVEFEEPADALNHFSQHGIRLSKLHLSSALRLRPTGEALEKLKAFAEDTYLHQVIVQSSDGTLDRYHDLDAALSAKRRRFCDPSHQPSEEWRIHFHLPLHYQPASPFQSTVDHLLKLLDLLASKPELCSHLEMETYTWEVLPEPLKSRTVVEQLISEYDWTLKELAGRGLGRAS